MTTTTRLRTAAAALGLTVAVAVAGPVTTTASAGAASGEAPTATTETGAVRGASDAGVEDFLGIPYAAPPVGDLRWQAPQPVQPWSDVRSAEQFGDPCPVLPSTNGPRSETEDCLFVNVQRPEGTDAEDPLPVFVFFHGGGLTNGSSGQNDMEKIVRETGVVGVTMNYRLGVLGFLGHSSLTTEDGAAGNYGFLDQRAALEWVQRNIGAFGGDPGAVTIGGESAGGWSVCGHMVSPGSQGLFDQAVIQSGSCPSQTPAQAQEGATAFAAGVGCTDPTTAARCLREIPVATLLDASAGFSSRFVHGTPTFPRPLRAAVESGDFARVPLLIGANRDEGRTFSQGLVGQSREAYEAFVRDSFGARADLVLAEYPWPGTADEFTAAYLAGEVTTDSGLVAGIGGCSNRELIRAFERWTPTHAYEFAHRTGPGLTEIPGYVWGAGHAAELAYLWPSFDNGTPIAPLFDAAEQQLADEMVQYWGAFVSTGEPQVDDQLDWPRFTDRRGATLSLRAGGESRIIGDAEHDAQHHCDFWTWLEEHGPA